MIAKSQLLKSEQFLTLSEAFVPGLQSLTSVRTEHLVISILRES